MDLSEGALRQYVAFGQERRNVEFKSSLDWSHYSTKLTKAALAMANNRDGGVIIIGRDDGGANVGIHDNDLQTFHIDAVLPFVNKYADPHVDLSLHPFTFEGAPLLAIGVEEFREVPVISARDSADGVLKRGALYVRSFRHVETTEVQGPEDMREMLNLATEKGIARFVRQARGAGMDLSAAAARSDAQAFEQQVLRAIQ